MKKFKKSLLAGMMFVAVTPALAADYVFDFQSSDPKGSQAYELLNAWTENVKKESNGRVEIHIHGGDGLVKYNETVDAMRLGLIDGHAVSGGYYAFKDPAFNLLGNTIGAWSDASQASDFMYNNGGNAILESLYAKEGVQLIGVYSEQLEAFVSTKPLDGVSDLKGMRIRVADDLTDAIFTDFGVKTERLSFSKVPSALSQGALDAADASMLAINHNKGLHKIATHPVYPGFHALNVKDISMSKKKWDALPADIQKILKNSVKELDTEFTNQLNKADKLALDKIQKDSSISVHNWSQEERKKFRQMAKKHWKIFSEKSEASKKTYDALVKYLTDNNLL